MSLEAWYRLTFILKHRYSWSVEEVERLYPFETEIYNSLLLDWLAMEKSIAEEARNKNAA